MYGKRGAAVAALAMTVAIGVTGCGAQEAGAGGFGREAAQAEIRAAVAGAGLPKSELPEPGQVTATATPADERERIAQRAAACSAAWQYVGPVADGSRGGFDEAVAALAGERWSQSQRQVEKLDDKGGTMVAVTLKKQGWTLYARHQSTRQGLSMDLISFQASEDSCMARFTAKELDTLFGEDRERP
ncbi:hypothetical protein [Streptomyces sp. LMG1-1-1.1]|uniref:hypothetical protein n=1 Tax=Streptomyces sp. LMG1-1-1.1 TaxID=3135245 RepID=UPI00346790ED